MKSEDNSDMPLEREPRPLKHLRSVGARFPGLWEAVAQVRAARRQGEIDWANECQVPVDFIATLADWLAPHAEEHYFRGFLCDAHAAIAWRPAKSIYHFDADLLERLKQTAISGEIPCQVLRRLPQWGLYVEGPYDWLDGRTVPGFYACYACRVGDAEARWLCIDVDSPDDMPDEGGTYPIAIELGYSGSLLDHFVAVVLHTIKPGEDLETELAEQREMSLLIAPMLSTLLYLCSDEPDIANLRHPSERPANPRPVKTRHGMKEFPASSVTTWQVGWRIGAVLRKVEKEVRELGEKTLDRRGPRPHIRAAHWHTYWTGKGRTEPRIKWLSPSLVNTAKDEDMPAVVRRVTV